MLNNSRTLVIAEVGVNHNGNIDYAKRLIDVASDAGADLVKFQTFNAERIVTQSAPKAEYQRKSTADRQSQLSMLRQLELSQKMHDILIEHCRSRNIDFFSTAFDIESLDYLDSLGFERFKVPSGEITNLPYLRRVGTFRKPVILSTGMSSMLEIRQALHVLESSGSQREQTTVLQCNTAYPTPMHDVNLRAMCSIRETFGVAVGYSDHTIGIEVPIAAVALGATVIEKHLTLDRNLPGPDHKASLEPPEFAAMVSSIRNVEQAMGDGIKRPSLSEELNRRIVRKSLVASKSIKAGEQFTVQNVSVKRPGTGISPMHWNDVIGQVATRDFQIDELISL